MEASPELDAAHRMDSGIQVSRVSWLGLQAGEARLVGVDELGSLPSGGTFCP